MTPDLTAATAFMATHARLLDRRRFELFCGRGEPTEVLAALEGYRNSDGGYGWGLEPDLRSPESQPAGALHALEVFAEVGSVSSARAVAVCDWLTTATLDDGGLPFALPVTDPAGCAPFWANADATSSSLHITSAVCSMAHRVAQQDPAVAAHPWLATATQFCLDAIDRISEPPHAIELMYILHFLDAVVDTRPEVDELLRRTVTRTSRPMDRWPSRAEWRTSSCARSTSHRCRSDRCGRCCPRMPSPPTSNVGVARSRTTVVGASTSRARRRWPSSSGVATPPCTPCRCCAPTPTRRVADGTSDAVCVTA